MSRSWNRFKIKVPEGYKWYVGMFDMEANGFAYAFPAIEVGITQDPDIPVDGSYALMNTLRKGGRAPE